MSVGYVDSARMQGDAPSGRRVSAPDEASGFSAGVRAQLVHHEQTFSHRRAIEWQRSLSQCQKVQAMRGRRQRSERVDPSSRRALGSERKNCTACLLDARRGGAVATGQRLLHRWALDRTIGTKHATVPWFGSHLLVAVRALMKIDTSIGWHNLDRREAACGTR